MYNWISQLFSNVPFFWCRRHIPPVTLFTGCPFLFFSIGISCHPLLESKNRMTRCLVWLSTAPHSYIHPIYPTTLQKEIKATFNSKAEFYCAEPRCPTSPCSAFPLRGRQRQGDGTASNAALKQACSEATVTCARISWSPSPGREWHSNLSVSSQSLYPLPGHHEVSLHTE